MAPKAVKLTSNSFEKDVLSKVKECVLKFDPQKEETVRRIFKNFIKKNKKDGILLFADQRKDKLSRLVAFKQECEKAGVRLSISLYCENKNPLGESEWYFREVDVSLSDELNEMIIW